MTQIVAFIFSLINQMPLRPTILPRITHKSTKWIFSAKVICSESEHMLDVAYGPILAEKSLKTLFLVKFPKV
jgi:hypothetical protein